MTESLDLTDNAVTLLFNCFEEFLFFFVSREFVSSFGFETFFCGWKGSFFIFLRHFVFRVSKEKFVNEFMKNWNWTKLEWHKKKIGKKVLIFGKKNLIIGGLINKLRFSCITLKIFYEYINALYARVQILLFNFDIKL